jgi:hypothetical protein
MREHKRLQGQFEWLSPQERRARSRLSPIPVPPNPPEYRRPVFWLATRNETEGEGAPFSTGLYLVNWSGETLSRVTSGSGGLQQADDAVLTFASDTGYSYEAVAHDEAVRVELFDNYYDLDSLFAVSVTVHSPSLGVLRLSTGLEKGRISEQVLLWDNGDPGRRAGVQRLDPEPAK